ncbi:MAG: glycosyltransferase family 4 protein [Rhodospirillaceae bacterium]
MTDTVPSSPPPGQARVLMISQFYRPEPIGSAPFCADLTEALAAAGHRVGVLTARPSYPENVVYAAYRDGSLDRQTVRGVDVARIATYLKPGGSTIDRLLNESSFMLNGAGALYRNRRAGRPDIVVALCPSVFGVLLASTLRRRGTRCIALVHDIQSGIAEGLGMMGGGIVGALRRMERLAFNRCDLLIVLSEEMRERLRMLGVRRPIHVHPIWIDTNAIEPAPSNPGNARLALYSGNFGRKQGLGQLVDAAAELARRNAEVRIRLRGNGSERAGLESGIASRGLTNVEVCDLLPPERLSAGLAEGDIHLVPQDPSVADYAVPSKIYAIMAAGRPFVATARPGSTLWRMQDETGAFLCVPPNDPGALADAILSLAANGEMRETLGRRARQYVTENCNKPDSLRRLIDIIRDTGMAAAT